MDVHKSGGGRGGGGSRSERHTNAGVLEAYGQDPAIDLMKLHQLQEVDEEGDAIVHGVVLPTVVFAL